MNQTEGLILPGYRVQPNAKCITLFCYSFVHNNEGHYQNVYKATVIFHIIEVYPSHVFKRYFYLCILYYLLSFGPYMFHTEDFD